MRLQTSPASWAALSLPVPLSADAEGSLGIKPRRDVNAVAHGGDLLKRAHRYGFTLDVISLLSRPIVNSSKV